MTVTIGRRELLVRTRRCGRRVAARGERAAIGEAADHWFPWRKHAFGLRPMVAAFVQRLRELGWIEGHTVAIEYRWAEGHSERFPEIAAELVRLKVDVIVTTGGAVLAAKEATTVTPIVFAVAADPVVSGMVTSLARPGGNVTGLALQSPDVAGKRLELLREVIPGLRRLAILANIGYPPSLVEMNEVQAMARPLGIEVATLEIRRAEDIAPAFDTLKGRADALYVCGSDPLVNANRAP